MEAEDYLNKALGGNLNISTLKPIVFVEIMEEYHQSQLQALKEEVKGQLEAIERGINNGYTQESVWAIRNLITNLEDK